MSVKIGACCSSFQEKELGGMRLSESPSIECTRVPKSTGSVSIEFVPEY